MFLESGPAIERIVRALGLQAEESLLEIGGGDGRLSERIAPLVRRLIVVELDPRFARLLREKFAGSERVAVVEGDILDEETFAAVRAAEPEGKLVVYGSLPYYITSPILRWIAGRPGDFRRAHLLVQREVAQRAAAEAGSRVYGFLSVLLQRRAELTLGPVARRGAFRPVPKVDSQLLTMVPRPGLDPAEEDRLERFIAPLFEQRRKKLRNTLRRRIDRRAADDLEALCARVGISLDDRPERLTPDEFYKLYRLITGAETENRG